MDLVIEINVKIRARTMTRFDGFENIGLLVGTALSPVILMNIGRIAIFGLQLGCVFLGTIYISLFLPQISHISCRRRKKIFGTFEKTSAGQNQIMSLFL